MTLDRRTAFAVLVSGGLAVSTTLLLAVLPAPIGVGVDGLLLAWVAFTLWPWAVMPVGLLGGTIAAVLIGYSDVRSIVAIHGFILVSGGAGLVTRRALRFDPVAEPVARSYRAGLVLVCTTIAVGALYGLAAGNAVKDVAVAVYQLAVIPVYFLAAIYTLRSPRQRRHAFTLYVGVISALTALEVFTPGRHGGLLGVLPIPALIVLSGRATGWRRAGLAVLAAGLSADVVLASYRGIWIAGGIALVILLVRGGDDIRRGLVATGVAGVAILIIAVFGIGLSGGLGGRIAVVGEALGRDAGYRVPEARVGLDVFASRPLLGAGLGQSTRHRYIQGFTVTDVGPVYHSFYIVLLANLGLIGSCAVLWPIGTAAWTALATRESMPLALASITCGFLAAALVTGPTDGHWELGLLPALIVLTTQAGRSPTRRRPAQAPALVPAAAR